MTKIIEKRNFLLKILYFSMINIKIDAHIAKDRYPNSKYTTLRDESST